MGAAKSAPTSRQALIPSANWRGESEMPGRRGTTSTPDGIPSSFSFRTASKRCRGWGVPGSELFQTSVSRVPTEKLNRYVGPAGGVGQEMTIPQHQWRFCEK